VKFVLLLNGWHDVEVDVVGEDVVARGRRDGENAIHLVAAVVAVVPEECKRLTLIAEDETGSHTATGPTEPFRRAADLEDVAKSLVHAVATAWWTIDGEPISSQAQTRKLFAYRAMEALNPDVPVGDALRILRAALDASKEVGLDDLAMALGWALRLRREVATGVTPTRSVEEVAELLGRWLVEDLPELRLSW